MLVRACVLILVFWIAGTESNVFAGELGDGDDIVLHRDLAYREGAGGHWKLDLAVKNDAQAKPRPEAPPVITTPRPAKRSANQWRPS